MQDHWPTFFGGALIALASGFGVWMFRIDRAVTRIAHLAETLRDFKRGVESEQRTVWSRLDQQGQKLAQHGERLSRIEALPRSAEPHR